MVRAYSSQDYGTLRKWLDVPEWTYPKDSTYVIEHAGRPAVVLSAYFTNDQGLALLENMVGDPALKGPVRKELSRALFDHVCSESAKKGFRRVLFMATNEKLKKRYQEFGGTVILENVCVLTKEL